MNLAFLPLAFSMNAFPQIISSIVFVTTPKPLSLSPPLWRVCDRRLRRRHAYLLPRPRAAQQHLPQRPVKFRFEREHHPVRASRAARIPGHQELRAPFDERFTRCLGTLLNVNPSSSLTTGLLLLSFFPSYLFFLLSFFFFLSLLISLFCALYLSSWLPFSSLLFLFFLSFFFSFSSF